MGGSEGCDVSQQLRDVVTHRIRDPDGEWRNVRHMTVRHTNSRSLDVDLHRLRRKSVENWEIRATVLQCDTKCLGSEFHELESLRSELKIPRAFSGKRLMTFRSEAWGEISSQYASSLGSGLDRQSIRVGCPVRRRVPRSTATFQRRRRPRDNHRQRRIP